MNCRELPWRPSLYKFQSEADSLLDCFANQEPEAVGRFKAFHPGYTELRSATSKDAQLVVARTYGIESWVRLELACQLLEAIHGDDADRVRHLVQSEPRLLSENARGRRKDNWGPPMSYAANLGRMRVIRTLFEMGAPDLQYAFDRACLQGQVEAATWLYEKGATLPAGVVMGACETQNSDGLRLLASLGAEMCDEHGDRKKPLALLLETYSRNPTGKHECLELLVEREAYLPDTPLMALHRGRIDLLEKFLDADRELINRRFSYREIYPIEVGCHDDESLGLHGTPLDGATLLHISVDYDEMEIAHWLLEQGANPNARAAIDQDGFGGHTPLFNAAVSQANVCGRQPNGEMTKILLEAGADPRMRASIRKRLRFVDDESTHEYRNVTPLEYARAFHHPGWTSRGVNTLLTQAMQS